MLPRARTPLTSLAPFALLVAACAPQQSMTHLDDSTAPVAPTAVVDSAVLPALDRAAAPLLRSGMYETATFALG